MSTITENEPKNIDFSGQKQFLTEKPILIYRGVDDYLVTDRDEIAASIHKTRSISQASERIAEQSDRIVEKIVEWANTKGTQVRGLGGIFRQTGWSISEELPHVNSVFAIVQAKEGAIDEQLWLDIADLDVEIAQMEEFSNINLRLIPMPSMEQGALKVYLDNYFKLQQ